MICARLGFSAEQWHPIMLEGHLNLHHEKELTDLATHLGTQLLRRQQWVVTAESCTGGWLAQVLTAVAGSSQWFERGFVTYSNAAKTEMLGVDPQLISTHGAVSAAVVRAMAQGALKNSHAQISVAISGIAGPSGGTAEKPVGTVWLAWANDTQITAQVFLFPGNRQEIRYQSVLAALHGLIKI